MVRFLLNLSASPDGTQLAYQGWGKNANDSAAFETIPVAGETPTRVFTALADHVNMSWLADGITSRVRVGYSGVAIAV